MALSTELKNRIRSAITDKTTADELIAAVEASVASPASNIAALGATADLSAIAGSYADLPAARTSVNTLKTEVEARLDAIEAKIDALLAALVAAGLMSA